jgi:hypothetical protein
VGSARAFGSPPGPFWSLIGALVYSRTVVFNPQELRTERFRLQMGYDAAFLFWNVEGVIAERWAHGPIFGAYNKQLGLEQVTLTPPPTEDDVRLQGVYGIKESWVHGEGEVRAPQAREIGPSWLQEVHEVLRPKKVTRVLIQLFALYPIDDAVQVSRRLRTHFYRNDHLERVLPDRLREERDRYHAAVDFLVPREDGITSLIAGVVGPVHAGSFFSFPDKDRDERWWMGLNYTLNRPGGDEGMADPAAAVRQAVEDAESDLDSVAGSVLGEVIP